MAQWLTAAPAGIKTGRIRVPKREAATRCRSFPSWICPRWGRLGSLYFPMMSRSQRIRYEILDCALNRTSDPAGYSTTVNMFLTRLGQLFPDIEKEEFRKACKDLTLQKAIEIFFRGASGYRNYQGADDEVEAEFFRASQLQLRASP